eukprot:TRINITY_DN21806_c0_g2_i2.p1 TRINITY_DN21806_c0_g2~~TRINITY_DN21806_c0_g2_i2.p1  ORF type:complete len:337 (+),score=53.92 TRINITY_DN21806_c0_g2_i2:521-1531(+)
MLTALYLNNVNLTGTISTEIGKLVSLSQLAIDNNNLSGTIPTELSYLTRLAELYLNNNQLHGTIPMGIYSFPYLTQFYTVGNQNLCTDCFIFSIPNSCSLGLICPCQCLNPFCVYDFCHNSCPGYKYGLGICEGNSLIIKSSNINSKTNISLVGVNAFIFGEVLVSLEFANSIITINGSYEGTNNNLSLKTSSLFILNNMELKNSIVLMDVLSSVTVTGFINLSGTEVHLDFNPDVPPGTYILFKSLSSYISMWPTKLSSQVTCPSIQPQISDHTFSVLIGQEVCFNNNMGISSGAVIGIVVGSVVFIVVIIGAFYFGFKKHQTTKQLQDLKVNTP